MPKGLACLQRTSRSKAPIRAVIGRSITLGQRSPLNSSTAVKRSPVASAGAVNFTTAATAWSVVTATGALPSLLLTSTSVNTGPLCGGGNSEGSTSSTSKTCTSVTAKRPADVSCLIVAETSASAGGDVTPPRATGPVPACTRPKSRWSSSSLCRPGSSRRRSKMPRSDGR